MGKHTQGPWNVAGCEIFSADNDKMIARVFSGAESNVLLSGAISAREADCNAALISSAPDLLAALEEITAAFQDFRDMEGLEERPEVEAALLAIARARGE